jgi:DNA-directed RNA polymerase subunit RPC12/RpoP
MTLRFKCADCGTDIIVEHAKKSEPVLCPHCKRIIRDEGQSVSTDSVSRVAVRRTGRSWSRVHTWANWLSICGVVGLVGFVVKGLVNLVTGNISQGVLDLVLAIPVLVVFNGFAQLLEVFVKIELNTRETRDALREKRD